MTDAAFLEVVVVVGDEVGIDAAFAQKIGKGVVERLERSPPAVQEIQATGLHVPPRGHAGETADIVVVKDQRACGERVEVRRRNG